MSFQPCEIAGWQGNILSEFDESEPGVYSKMKQWYEALFENYAEKYDKECFVQGTVGECDFIEEETARDKSLKIIDIGCGTGRHAIELTKRGYSVTGVDLSENQIKRAREKAQEAGVTLGDHALRRRVFSYGNR
jgi:2-polyprenyl-3-methyl-5-hydroxy-6-metoxy-1,4-benzoquinol methylase